MKYLLFIFFFLNYLGFSQEADTLSILKNIEEAKTLIVADQKKSKILIKKALNASRKINFLRGEAISYFGLGMLDFYDLKYDTAIDLYEKSLNIFNQLEVKDSMYIHDCNYNIAVCYEYRDKYIEASNYLLEALKYADIDIRNSISCYMHLGKIQDQLENYKEAIKYTIIAFDKAKSIADSSYMVHQSAYLIGYYLETNELDKAENLVNFIKPYLTESTDSFSKLNLYIGFCDFYLETGSLKKALLYAKKLENHTTPYKNFDPSAFILCGKIYYESGDFAEAEKYLLNALKSSKELNDKSIESDSYLYLSKLYEQKKRYAEAFYYSDKYIILKDSTEKDKNLKIVSNLLLGYENEKKGKELMQQKFTIQNQEQTNAYQNIVLVLLLFILAMSIFFLYKSKKNHNLVTQQKGEISAALEHSELLRRELHHRVKNNLQLISSYWDLQTNKIKDIFTLKVIEEGQNQIYAISMVHQLLYKKGEETLVNMEDYVSSLFQKMSLPNYGIDISLDVRVKEIQFNFNQAISLGLILNELFTNTKKHAFNGTKKGHVTISISKNNLQEYNLKYSDNGTGLSTNYNTNSSDSLGLKIIQFLSEELNGKYKMYNDNGANFELFFN